MLVPGLPPAGAVNDRVRINKTVKPLAEAEFIHDLVTASRDRRQQDQGHWPERRRQRRDKAADNLDRQVAPEQQAAQAADASAPHDLPDKGLLIDLEV